MKNFYFLLLWLLPTISCGGADLQTLVDRATDDGELHLEKRTYVLKKPLSIPSNFKLYGNGATLEPSSTWRKDNDEHLPLIEIVNVSNIYISDLIFDNKAKRSLQGMPSNSILILRSKSIVLKNNEFKDLGLKKNDRTRHGSPFILIAVQEAPHDFSYIPAKYGEVTGSVEDIQILNNTFINKEYVNSFAIRIVSLWTKGRKKESLQQRTENIILANNKFYGEYDWNTLEMAGPATRDITVERNLFSGKSITNIDVDKGASDIIIRDNTLRDLGLPMRHKDNNNVRVSPIMVHGNEEGYECENVLVLDNVINGITNPEIENSRFLYSSGIAVLHARNVEIKGNRILNVFAGKNYGAAICLDQSILNITIADNDIEEAYRGIVVTPNTRRFKNIVIEDNSVSTRSEPLMVSATKGGMFSGLRVKNNSVNSTNNKRISLSRNISEIDSDAK